MNKISLKADVRTETGRKVKKIRKAGKTPANIFGRNFKSQAISIDRKEFDSVYQKAGETGLVEISVGSEKKPVLIHERQIDPITDEILHVDFLQVDLKQKVSAMVPVELVGESPAEKQSVGTIVQYIDEIEVEALPEDLPDKFEIDLSILENVDQALHVKDIKVDKSKVEIAKDGEEVIVKVEPPKEEKEEVVAEAPATEEGQPAEPTDSKEENTPENKE